MPAPKSKKPRRPRRPKVHSLPALIAGAVKSGPVPVLRDVHWLYQHAPDELTLGEQVILFGELYLRVPEGIKVGQPLVLDPFQKAFILAVVDNPHGTRDAVLSMARRNGKTFVLAIIVLAYLAGPLAIQNATIASAAQSRDQAALLFNLMTKMVAMSPEISPLLRIIPSSKRIISLATGTEYYAMSADARTGYGRALRVVVLDESGQIRGPNDEYVDMLRSSQGSFSDPLFVTISTQAPSDNDWLSIQIDDGVRNQSPNAVVHLYCADPGADMLDPEQWEKSNPGLGSFRSRDDLQDQLERASRLPVQEATARNLLLNQRVAQVSLWLAPSPWRDCGGEIDFHLFQHTTVALGLDLSSRNDLTAAVLAACDDEATVHLLPYVFCPLQGIEERSKRDRTPYDTWVRDGLMVGLAGASMDYDQIMEFLRDEFERLEISPDLIEFDRWRIELAKAAAERVGFAQGAEWHEVGQGYRDMSPRIENFEGLMLNGKLRHGNHPLLTMGAANAIATKDPTGARKVDKSKSTARIDPIVAAVMAAFPVSEGVVELEDSMYNDMDRAVIM